MNGSRKRGARPRRGPERRQPPPVVTGQEQQWFAGALREGAALCLHLRNGETLRGRIEDFDPHAIHVATRAGHRLLVPLTEIRYIEDV